MTRCGASDAPVLVTGFAPFAGQDRNAAWEAVRLLPDSVGGRPIVRRQVPCVFGESGDLVCALVDELRPSCVVCVGQAAGRSVLTVEEVAVNRMTASIPDERGREPHREPVVADGPAAYLSTMPLDACVDAARACGVPADVSQTAGRYVCNQLMYRVLDGLARRGRADVPAGFVHVPLMPSQAGARPSMDARLCASGLLAMLGACLGTDEPSAAGLR